MSKLVKTGTVFSEKSVNFIVKNAGKMKLSSIAKVLHRTTGSVQKKAERLGVSTKLN